MVMVVIMTPYICMGKPWNAGSQFVATRIIVNPSIPRSFLVVGWRCREMSIEVYKTLNYILVCVKCLLSDNLDFNKLCILRTKT